jgi:hypothetical protein
MDNCNNHAGCAHSISYNLIAFEILVDVRRQLYFFGLVSSYLWIISITYLLCAFCKKMQLLV